MKKLFTTLFLFGFFSLGYGQKADLTLTSGSFSPTSVQSSSLLTITCLIKNQGNVTAPTSHVRLCISTSNTSVQEVWGTDISVESIPANSNCKLITTAKVRIPNSIATGNYYVWILIDNRGTSYPYHEVDESNEGNNNFPSNTPLSITNNPNNKVQNIPYPIIFIHGLTDDDRCWSTAKPSYGPGYSKMLYENFGWSSGSTSSSDGVMKFCLNSDNNSTQFNYDITDFTDESKMSKADYYFVSFDVDPYGNDYNSTQGSPNYLSNQSAIRKQGVAISDAVQHVRNVTGAKKVILVGHSMGGLAAREYIQSGYYQNDVAKLFTSGTPHGGSQATNFNIGAIDWDSEGVRDLRNHYSTNSMGVYLFGTIEDPNVFDTYYDYDVNCNGQNYDNITGLYYKPLPTDIYYSCAIGVGTLILGGDGVVQPSNANLNEWNNTSSTIADTFHIQTPGYNTSLLHSHLSSFEFAEANTRGLDEPPISKLAYEIMPNKLYFGNITKGSNWTATSIDHDWYKFTLPSSGILSINVYNIPVSNFYANLFDQVGNQVTYNSYGQSNISSGQISITQSGPPEQYFLDLSGIADMYSFWFPYAFSITFSPATGTEEISNKISDVVNYPDPFHDKTTISFNLNESQNVSLKVYNTLGEIVATLIDGKIDSGKHNVQFDGTNLSAGMYYYEIHSDNYFKSGKMILEK